MQVLVQLCFVMTVLHMDVDEALWLMEASKESLHNNNGKNIVET